MTVTTPPSRSTMMVSVLTATPYPGPAPGPRPTRDVAHAAPSEGVLEHLDLEDPPSPVVTAATSKRMRS